MTFHRSAVSYIRALQQTGCENTEATVRTKRFLWSEALLSMCDHKLPKRIMSGELDNEGQRGPGGGRNNKWRSAWQGIVGCSASRGIGAPRHYTLGFGTAQYAKGAAGLRPREEREEKKASENWQRKRDAEEADKVKVAPGNPENHENPENPEHPEHPEHPGSTVS